MTLDSLPDLDTSGLCLVKTLSTALTCWPYRNTALRNDGRTSTRTSAARAGSGIEAVPLATDEVRVDVRPSFRSAVFRYGQHVSAVERVFTRHNPLVFKSGRLSRVMTTRSH